MARRARRGMTLMEVMVAIAIMLVLLVVLVPSIASIFEVKQRKAAKEMALLYERVNDEAVMRNRTFRFTFFLTENRYQVEMGDVGALINATPEEREDFERERQARIALADDDEKRKIQAATNPFKDSDDGYKMDFELPAGVVFGGVYTPQYGEMMEPDYDRDPDDDEEDGPQRVFSHVFANGFTEHTVIWLVDKDDPEDGWTIEVEPLSGAVELHGELLDWEDSYDFVPEEGPDLPT